jgi:hypothetical protein
MPLSQSVQFTSERFDYSSELPTDYNAGNRFYGKDVAEFISAELTRSGLQTHFLDEDWGWLIFSLRGTTPEFEVAIYNLSEHSEGGRPGTNQWRLWVRSYERRKLFGLLPKKTEVAVPPRIVNAIAQAVSAAGAVPQPCKDGPE